MAIQKQMTSPTGIPTNYHKILRIDLLGNEPELTVHVGSWVTEDSALSNDSPAWNTYLKVSAGNLYQLVQSNLVLLGEFQGGTVLLDPDTLEKTKQRKWLEIKNYRDAVEAAGFFWDNSKFDSDTVSQSRIQGGVQLAILAQQAGQPFSINWTLQDNSTRVLSGTDMIQVGMALAQHVQTLHETARILRAQIDAATTPEEVAAINWPQ